MISDHPWSLIMMISDHFILHCTFYRCGDTPNVLCTVNWSWVFFDDTLQQNGAVCARQKCDALCMRRTLRARTHFACRMLSRLVVNGVFFFVQHCSMSPLLEIETPTKTTFEISRWFFVIPPIRHRRNLLISRRNESPIHVLLHSNRLSEKELPILRKNYGEEERPLKDMSRKDKST